MRVSAFPSQDPQLFLQVSPSIPTPSLTTGDAPGLGYTEISQSRGDGNPLQLSLGC